jgi:hypothetical protein
MQKIHLYLVRDGMVLGKEVVRPERSAGPPLFGKGMTLSAAHIERLATMGIQAIVVEGGPVAIEGDASLEQQLNDLDERFSRWEYDAVMQKIKASLHRHINKLMGA